MARLVLSIIGAVALGGALIALNMDRSSEQLLLAQKGGDKGGSDKGGGDKGGSGSGGNGGKQGDNTKDSGTKKTR